MRKIGLMLLIGFFMTCGLARPAMAILPFFKEFTKLYDNEDPDSQLGMLLKNKKQRCLVCHQGKKKKNHNPYGIHFVELLDKKKDKKDVDKIIASLKKVAELPSDPEDDKSPTYGELIEAGKLPGGPLEELLKEPSKKEEETET